MQDEKRKPGNYIYSGHELMSAPLAAYVFTRIIVCSGPNWRSQVQNRYQNARYTDGRLNRDVIINFRIMEHFWKEVFRPVLEKKLLHHIRKLCDSRNEHHYQQPHSPDDAARILETMNLLMSNIKADKAVANLNADIDAFVAELKELRKELQAKLSDLQDQSPQGQPPPEPPATVSKAPASETHPQSPSTKSANRYWKPENVELILQELKQRTFYAKTAGIQHFTR